MQAVGLLVLFLVFAEVMEIEKDGKGKKRRIWGKPILRLKKKEWYDGGKEKLYGIYLLYRPFNDHIQFFMFLYFFIGKFPFAIKK